MCVCARVRAHVRTCMQPCMCVCVCLCVCLCMHLFVYTHLEIRQMWLSMCVLHKHIRRGDFTYFYIFQFFENQKYAKRVFTMFHCSRCALSGQESRWRWEVCVCTHPDQGSVHCGKPGPALQTLPGHPVNKLSRKCSFLTHTSLCIYTPASTLHPKYCA